ncbi:MAG: dTDP-4-dehydrorhamnose 3,5-epimerase family protein [Alphaproteobacteria bacterium]|nr:dTDP-4-dehydrorhamnose 3,5-epimerase family protein [Alphaproteobacteria bacterium]
MKIVKTAIPDIKLLKPVRHVDSRGFFSKVFKESGQRERGIEIHFVRDNHSFIPEEFAHGHCTLKPNTEFSHKVSVYFSPGHDRRLLWNDPTLDVGCPVSADEALVSDRDRKHPVLSSLPGYFRYEPPSNPQG